MNLRNWTQAEENVESRNVRRNNSDAVRGTIVVTPGNILKFALFFVACLLVSMAIVGWLTGYLGSAP